MSKQQNYIENNRPALFDWIVFITSVSLGFIFPTFRSFIASPVFSWCMLSSLVLYSAGAWLKHLPLYHRIIKSGKPEKSLPYLLFLLIGHWLIFLTVFILAENAIRKMAGMPAATPEDRITGYFMFSSIAAATFVTWLVFRGRKRISTVTNYSKTYLYNREIVADVFLMLSVSVLSFAFWEKGIMALLTHKPVVTIGDVWFIFLFLSIAFLLFYLPLRYLYLIEDRSSRQTRKRLLFIFALLLIRSLFEMLRI